MNHKKFKKRWLLSLLLVPSLTIPLITSCTQIKNDQSNQKQPVIKQESNVYFENTINQDENDKNNYLEQLNQLLEFLFPEWIKEFEQKRNDFKNQVLKNDDTFVSRKQYLSLFKKIYFNELNKPINHKKDVYEVNKKIFDQVHYLNKTDASLKDEKQQIQGLIEKITKNHDLYIDPNLQHRNFRNKTKTRWNENELIFEEKYDYLFGSFKVMTSENDNNENFVYTNYALSYRPPYYHKMKMQFKSINKDIENIYFHPTYYYSGNTLVLKNLNKNKFKNELSFARIYTPNEIISPSFELKENKNDHIIDIPSISLIPKEIIPINHFDNFLTTNDKNSPYATKFEVRINNIQPFEWTIVNSNHLYHLHPKQLYEFLKTPFLKQEIYHDHSHFIDEKSKQIPLDHFENSLYYKINNQFKTTLNHAFKNINSHEGLLRSSLMMNKMLPMVYKTIGFMFKNENNPYVREQINQYDQKLSNTLDLILEYMNDLINKNNLFELTHHYQSCLFLLSTIIFYLNNPLFTKVDDLNTYLKTQLHEIKSNRFLLEERNIIIE